VTAGRFDTQGPHGRSISVLDTLLHELARPSPVLLTEYRGHLLANTTMSQSAHGTFSGNPLSVVLVNN